MKTEETAKPSQGDKVADKEHPLMTMAKAAAAEAAAEDGEKKKEERNPSSTYTIKSLTKNIKKLEKLKMCNAQELAELKKIHKAVTERWIGGNLGI